jgi:hypothetical protein
VQGADCRKGWRVALMLPGFHAPRTKQCSMCSKPFTPARPLQSVCSPRCAAKIGKVKRAKEKNAEKLRKRALVKISDLEEQCRKIVQKIARIRDRDRGCISCDKPAGWDGQWHGSHYRAHGGCSSLQFHLWNINKACWICNKIYSGRRDGYQVGIVERYGRERLEWLDAQPKSKKFSREYLERFKEVMGKRARRLEKRMDK